MRAKPQFRQRFILTLLDIRAHVSARSVSDIFFVFFLSCHFSQPGLVGFGFLSRACARNPSFGNILSSRFFTFVPTVLREASRTFFFFVLFILSFCRSRVLWVLVFCRVHAPETAVLASVTPEFDFPSCSKSLRSPENPCPKHNSVRVPKAIDHQSIHAQTIIPFVFQEHAIDHQSIHAQTIIPFVFQEQSITRASMPKP